MNINTDEIYTFKLNTGEELVARLVEIQPDHMIIENPILTVLYNPSATLYMINTGSKQAAGQGFYIGKHSGLWKSADSRSNRRKQTEREDDPTVHVRLFTQNQADILYLQPVSNLQLSEGGRITLSYALKRGIEKRFQVEQNEVGVWIMGKQEAKNILLYESSEGSLGVMKELAENGQALRQVFVEAYKVCHFDPDTRTDTRPDLEKASYDDLLSYYNQRDHDHIDRHAVKEALELLIDSTVSPLRATGNYEEHYQHLLTRYDENSIMELDFLRHLYSNGLALPDLAQKNLDGLYTSVDFIYNSDAGPVLVFIDGNKGAEVDAKQQEQRQKCRDAGYLDIIEWRFTEKIESLIERRKDIFRKVR